MTNIMKSIRIRPGKAEYIRWANPKHGGAVEDLCVCSHNVDFSFGCIAHVRGKDLQGVYANDGKYADIAAVIAETGRTAFGCDYCYARFQGRGNAYPVTSGRVDEKTREDMEALVKQRPDPNGRIIRLGKNTEVGHPFYRETLIEFLQLCQEYDTRVIMPTKMLEFNIVLATLLRETRSAVNFSIVGDFLEEGPVTQGFDQKWRGEQALAYHTAGVRASVTLTCDMSASLQHNREVGYAVDVALDTHSMGVPLRLLPMRMPSKPVTLKASGRTWEALISGNAVLPGMEDPRDGINYLNGAYASKPGGFLELQTLHPDFAELYDRLNGKQVGACGKVRGYEHCDKCGLAEKRGTVPMFRVSVEQLAPPPFFERRVPRKKKKNGAKTTENMPLFPSERRKS